MVRVLGKGIVTVGKRASDRSQSRIKRRSQSRSRSLERRVTDSDSESERLGFADFRKSQDEKEQVFSSGRVSGEDDSGFQS